MQSGHKIFLFEASGPCCRDECALRDTGTDQAIHGVINAPKSKLMSVIRNRPLFAKPVTRLFDCREFLDVTIGDGEVQGFAPVYFYHGWHMGSGPASFNGAAI